MLIGQFRLWRVRFLLAHRERYVRRALEVSAESFADVLKEDGTSRTTLWSPLWHALYGIVAFCRYDYTLARSCFWHAYERTGKLSSGEKEDATP